MSRFSLSECRTRLIATTGLLALVAWFFRVPAYSQGPARDVPEPKKIDVPPALRAPMPNDPSKKVPQPATEAADEPGLEVHFTDNSVMKLSLKEERITLITKYGNLDIPVADIHRIDFALRIPNDAAKRIEAALADMGHSQFRIRERAGEILLGQKEKAYPALMKATKHSDPEIAGRAEALVKKLEEIVPAELLKEREFDVVHTAHSKIAGKIEANSLKATTLQFGEVQLQLVHVMELRSKNSAAVEDAPNVVPAPATLTHLQAQIGQTFRFKVTANPTGSV